MPYVIKKTNKEEYITIDENNNIIWTKNIQRAKTFEQTKAQNLLTNHSFKDWNKGEIVELDDVIFEASTPTLQAMEPLADSKDNQIEHIEKLAQIDTSNIHNTPTENNIKNLVDFSKSLLYVKNNIAHDIEYYNDRLLLISRCITDINHYKENLNPVDIKKIIDIGILEIDCLKERRDIKIKIDILNELRQEFKHKDSRLKEKVFDNPSYRPRQIPELFETNRVPTLSEILKKHYEKKEQNNEQNNDIGKNPETDG